MPNTFENLQTRHEVAALGNLSSERQRLIHETVAVIDAGSPYIVANRMMNLSYSLPSQVEREVIEPLMQKCLESTDPLIRWSGIYAANAIEEKQLVKHGLERDYSSFLIRPDPTPWWAAAWWREEQNWFNRLNAAATVAALRASLIEMLGEYDIREAKPILRAIIADNWEWYDEAKHSAEKSLKALEQESHDASRGSRNGLSKRGRSRMALS